ncbi:TSUP family transporter [Roseomonas sp. SSH11]|uniref:Probable membrane transporter protein n=1 Tax=Pararoseomonas baculiformis TaxID=2820812 RepID=A0ABS4AAT1_9PROT|nr:TSUP family transporter [Pararoseomonas baculiformis]MBP0444111.1 TSUP family transporter [Pararoseomonas baculiformis]
MSPMMLLGLTVLMVATALLSGVFGMAGGLVLIGVLLAVLPVADAMVLHAVTQMASNGWRAALWWRYVRLRPMANYLLGALLALLALALVNYVPSRPVALLMLGTTPFLVRLLPPRFKPDPHRLGHGLLYGAACMTLMILTGVSGPLMDSFFLGGRLERREIVATKAACQIFSHGGKLLYFGGLVSAAGELDPLLAALAIGASVIGTTLAKPILEMLSDTQYRAWATRIITVIALYYIAQGAWEMFRA